MMALGFLTGAGYVTSYNIRMSATQAYVPNELRGRFNGAFAMFTTLGGVVGQLALGALGDVFNGRTLIAACMGLQRRGRPVAVVEEPPRRAPGLRRGQGGAGLRAQRKRPRSIGTGPRRA